jgi:cytochrome c2
MFAKRLCAVLFVALGGGSSTFALADELTDGAKLYIAHCKMCHGDNTGGQAATNPDRGRVQLAFAFGADERSVSVHANMLLAFAPPFGPSLKGIVGRPAGTAEKFEYSKAFMKALTGMTWDEGTLDWWIRDTQAWVPGALMVYKQTDPEVRRKIIAYLKANP